MSEIESFGFRDMNGSERTLKDFKGKVLLIVNVASKCGLTPQYEGLEKLYEKYRDRGLVVMGFPANEFLKQEPGSNQEIQEFCRSNYGVQFPMFEKVVVKGQGQHPLFKYLTESSPERSTKLVSSLVQWLKEQGLLGNPNDILWNFEKFLIGRDGQIAARFAPDFDPQDPKIIEAIEKAL